MVAISRRAILRWREAMVVLGLGLGVSGARLAWDYIVHEVLHEPAESIGAPPHVLIFLGIGVMGLAFLRGLGGPRLRAVSTSA